MKAESAAGVGFIAGMVLLLVCITQCFEFMEADVVSPSTCGTIAGLACDIKEYCKYPTSECLVNDNSGVCVPVPEVCTEEWLPVCGCDGVTHSNECAAAMAGVSIAYDGSCTRRSTR